MRLFERGVFMYATYEQPFTGRIFTERQMRSIYQSMVDKTEYPDFEGWIFDMLKSGVYEKMS